MRRTKGHCAYCGITGVALGRDHVVPKGLYPPPGSAAKIQRITVASCEACNNSFSDDETHFRNVLLLAGEPNEAVHEIWRTKVARSLREIDARKRLKEINSQLRPVVVNGENRHMIYPGNDQRVIRIIRKIARGLSSFHGFESAVNDSRVWADVLRYSIGNTPLEELPLNHRDEKVFSYRHGRDITNEISSAWVLTFYNRTTFIATVTTSNP